MESWVPFAQAPKQWAETLAGLEWTLRCQIVGGAALLSSIYLRLVVARVPYGILSLLVAAPVFFINAWLPLLFVIPAELISRTAVVFLFTWLGSMKASSTHGGVYQTIGTSDCALPGIR